jgi:hypothetical protein
MSKQKTQRWKLVINLLLFESESSMSLWWREVEKQKGDDRKGESCRETERGWNEREKELSTKDSTS